MFRRLRTQGLPGRPETGSVSYEWDFRLPGEHWVFELPMRSAGSPRARPRKPEQAAWMLEQGFGEPDPRGRHGLSPEALERLIALLEPLAEIPWAAWEAVDRCKELQMANQPQEAVEAAKQAVAAAPGWDLAWRQLIELQLFWLQDADEAEAALDAVPEGLIPARELLQRRQALALQRGEDWTRYAELQREIIDVVEARYDHWEVLGLSWWAAQDLERSIAAFEEGLSRHPGERELENRLAEVLHAAGRGEDARALLDRLIAEDPANAKSWALRAWVLWEQAPAQAESDLAEALARDPEQAVAQVTRGLLRLAAGQLEQAGADLAPHRHSPWAEARAAYQRYLDAGGQPPPEPEQAHEHTHAHGSAGEPEAR